MPITNHLSGLLVFDRGVIKEQRIQALEAQVRELQQRLDAKKNLMIHFEEEVRVCRGMFPGLELAVHTGVCMSDRVGSVCGGGTNMGCKLHKTSAATDAARKAVL